MAITLRTLPNGTFSVQEVLQIYVVARRAFNSICYFLNVRIVCVSVQINECNVDRSHFFTTNVDRLIQDHVPDRLFSASPEFRQTFMEFSFRRVCSIKS